MKTQSEFMTGASYYPERWNKEQWEVDAQMMKEAGFGFVRMGEFAWSRFEPADGAFDFGWMEEAIDLFLQYGIRTILCTPTAAPVPWITARHPDILPVTQEGKPFLPGQRRHYCFNSSHYRDYTQRIVTAMAEQFSSHPGVMGWQIDNEIGGEEFICCCDNCRKAFQSWLKKKYGSLSELNRRWGGVFFSFEFTGWEEINVPMGHNLRFFNPTFRKDYLHFYSDSMREYLYLQYDLLHARVKEVPVTTNRFSLFWVDMFDHTMDSRLDVVAFDNYDHEPSLAGFHHDFYRSLKKGRKHWVLEQSADLTGLGENLRDLTLQTVESAARGAELVCYFPWRTMSYGCEQDYSGVVRHDGSTGGAYQVIKQTNEWLRGEGKGLAQLQQRNEIAILHSYESSVIYKVSHVFSGVEYHKEVYERFYRPVFELGLGVDFIRDLGDVGKYKLLIIPLNILQSDEMTALLENYVKAGGTVLVSGDFMLKNTDIWRVFGESNQRLDTFLGIRRERLLMVEAGTGSRVRSALSGKEYGIFGFFHSFSVEESNAAVLGTVASPAIEQGRPAASLSKLGNGRVIFLASLFEKEFIKEIVREIAGELDMRPVDLPDKTELVRLYDEEGKPAACLIINKGSQTAIIELKREKARIEIPPMEFKFVPLDAI